MSFVRQYSSFTYSFSIYSQIKQCRTSICFVLAQSFELCISIIALQISLKKVFCLLIVFHFSSFRKFSIQIISLIALMQAVCSTFIVEVTTVDCFLNCQNTIYYNDYSSKYRLLFLLFSYQCFLFIIGNFNICSSNEISEALFDYYFMSTVEFCIEL